MTTTPGAKTLLLGPTGTGKTYALRTLLEAGLTPFIIATEPGLHASLGDVDPSRYHYIYMPPAVVPWNTLIKTAKDINIMSFEMLTKQTNMNKREYSQYYELLTHFTAFTCQHCGQNFGPVDDWGPDKVLVIDSMSGVNIMAMDLVTGSKPVKNPGEYQVAQTNLENFINRMCFGLQCHIVITGHIERERDEITGGVKLMISSIGQKLAPKLPRYFDNVVLAQFDGREYSWATAHASMDLKGRHLPISNKMPPTFQLIQDGWKEKGGKVENAK